MRTTLALILASFLLVSCGERAGDFREAARSAPPATPAPAPVPAPAPQPQIVVKPLDSAGFADAIKTAYSREKLSIPKRLMDSAMRLNDPKKINAVLERYMARRDSIVRAGMAENYRISSDSLDVILGKREAGKR